MKQVCLIEGSNPRGSSNDPYVDFRNYTTYDDAKWRSWHSIPCSLKTEFFPYSGSNFHECYKYDGFIVLFNHDPEYLIPFVKKLKLMGKKVAVGYHEGFGDFLLKSSQDFKWLENCKKLVNEADFYLNVMPSKNLTYQEIFQKHSVPTYHGAPFGHYDNLIVPREKREGIIISTRTFSQRLWRNTLWSLVDVNAYCKKNNTHFTLVCEDEIPKIPTFDRMQTISGPLNYNSWLSLIAKHKFMFGHDEAHSMAQMSLDAALVDVVGFGGNGEFNDLMLSNCSDINVIQYNHYDDHHRGGHKINCLKAECSFQAIAENILDAFGFNPNKSNGLEFAA